LIFAPLSITMLLIKAVSGLAVLAGLVAAHPGHDVAQEAAEQRAYLQSAKRTSLAHCADRLKARGIEARNIARRKATIDKARQKRGLNKRKRDVGDALAKDNNMTELGYTRNTDATTLFAGYNSCLLNPESIVGPYCKAPTCYRTPTDH
jgi:hypothetical protein